MALPWPKYTVQYSTVPTLPLLVVTSNATTQFGILAAISVAVAVSDWGWDPDSDSDSDLCVLCSRPLDLDREKHGPLVRVFSAGQHPPNPAQLACLLACVLLLYADEKEKNKKVTVVDSTVQNCAVQYCRCGTWLSTHRRARSRLDPCRLS